MAEDTAASASKDVEAAIQEEEQDATEHRLRRLAQAGTGAAPAYASPAVRRLARERGVDLSTIRGSGAKGRITKEDVEKPQAKVGCASRPGLHRGSPALRALKVKFERYGEIERLPLTRIQKISCCNSATWS